MSANLFDEIEWIFQSLVAGDLHPRAADKHVSAYLDRNSVLVIREPCSDRILSFEQRVLRHIRLKYKATYFASLCLNYFTTLVHHLRAIGLVFKKSADNHGVTDFRFSQILDA